MERRPQAIQAKEALQAIEEAGCTGTALGSRHLRGFLAPRGGRLGRGRLGSGRRSGQVLREGRHGQQREQRTENREMHVAF